MKKLLLSIAFLVSVFAFSPNSNAMMCETSQALFGGDACYTKVTVSSSETAIVSQGHALVYHIDENTPRQGAYEVVLSNTSADAVFLAGFAQENIASGQTGLVLVRGFGFVRPVGGIASGDHLFVTVSGNVSAAVGNEAGGHVSEAISRVTRDPVAVALGTSATNGDTARQAFIKVM